MNKSTLFLTILALVLSGCSNKFKQKMGLLTTGPNEYQVMRNKPLEMPPHFDLKEVEQRAKREQAVTSAATQDLNPAELELLKAARGE